MVSLSDTNVFNVLCRTIDLNRNYLLEASAGTGKTFAIENIVVRLLMGLDASQQKPSNLNEILLVTFTRAATCELKLRLRTSLKETLGYIRLLQEGKKEEKELPDYLFSLTERSEKEIGQFKLRLESALSLFDEAQIFTIHSFCFRMLKEYSVEADQFYEPSSKENSLSSTKVLKIIKDFLRTEVTFENYCPAQIQIILEAFKGSIDDLALNLKSYILQNFSIIAGPSFEEAYTEFKDIMRYLSNEWDPTPNNILSDFERLAPFYQKTCNRQSQIHPHLIEQVKVFAQLWSCRNWTREQFNQLIATGIVIATALDPKLLKARSKTSHSLPKFFLAVQQKLWPLIKQARDPLRIKARMARDCKAMLQRICSEEEIYTPDSLLINMEKATYSPLFLESVRQRYKAIIIDEFQDTDSVQWNIFKRLFYEDPHNRANIFLVGDPKQSIYGFRGADLYSYLEAAKTLGNSNHATLDTNYRSHPILVHALNTLFSSKHLPSFLTLPKTNNSLPYREVLPGKKNEKSIEDNTGALHFFIASGKGAKGKTWPPHDLEQQAFFPFIIKEIKKLFDQNISLKECVILVKDRYQGDRIAAYFSNYGISSVVRRSETLASSPATDEIKLILKAVICPSDTSAVRAALGGKLLGWTDSQLKIFINQWKEEPFACEKIYAQFYHLREKLFQGGFALFFQQLMLSCWHKDGKTVSEKILSSENGLELHTDCYHLAELLIEYQQQTRATSDTLFNFFTQLSEWDTDQDDRIILRRASDQDAVQILTLHMSKGLEFGVVFAIGLCNRSPLKKDLIKLQGDETPILGFPDEVKSSLTYEEEDAEKMRLLYVAMTRAKKRIYVPIAIDETGKELELGSASPIELLFARLNELPSDYQNIYQRISQFSLEIIKEKLLALQVEASITFSYISEESNNQRIPSLRKEVTLIPPKIPIIPGDAQYIYSYSSLLEHLSKAQIDMDETPLQNVPHDRNPSQKSVYTLPAGKETGTFLHHLFERISFNKIKNINTLDEMRTYLLTIVRIPNLFLGWENVLAEVLFNATKTVLTCGQERFCISDIEDHFCYKEMEFLYPYDSDNFMKGYIDLIFQYNGKYYILDWKSNYLGSTFEAYLQINLKKIMESQHYILQGELYEQALKRYLSLVEKRPFQECYGGILYLFLRGISPTHGSNFGFYHFKSRELL